MFEPRDVRPLTEFQRNAKQHIARLKKTGRPEVLTVNGRAAVVVLDADSYARLMHQHGWSDHFQSLQRGVWQAKAGAGRPQR